MREITNGVYVLESTKSAYCYLVMAEEIVLIDTGLGFMGKAMLKELRAHQIQLTDIKHIILTHYDLDHIGNVNRLQEPGHICLIYEDALFTGDLVEEKNKRLIPYPENWNWDTTVLLQSIEKIRDYSFKWVCVAHGNPIKRRDI